MRRMLISDITSHWFLHLMHKIIGITLHFPKCVARLFSKWTSHQNHLQDPTPLRFLSISTPAYFPLMPFFFSIVQWNPPPSFSFTFAVHNIHMPHAELSVHGILLSLFFHCLYFSSSFQSSQSPSSLSAMLAAAFLWSVAPGPDSNPTRGQSVQIERLSETQ